MKDGLSFIVAVIVASLLMFMIPLTASLERRDQLAYMMTYRTVTQFVDDVCVKGKITAAMYRDFQERLAHSGVPLKTELTHTRIRYVLADNQPDTTADWREMEEQFYTPQIVEWLFPGEAVKRGIYYMNIGDSFEVLVANKEPTRAMNMRSWLSANAEQIEPAIWIPYGCMIRHETH
jgi:hypothetical protein